MGGGGGGGILERGGLGISSLTMLFCVVDVYCSCLTADGEGSSKRCRIDVQNSMSDQVEPNVHADQLKASTSKQPSAITFQSGKKLHYYHTHTYSF